MQDQFTERPPNAETNEITVTTMLYRPDLRNVGLAGESLEFAPMTGEPGFVERYDADYLPQEKAA